VIILITLRVDLSQSQRVKGCGAAALTSMIRQRVKGTFTGAKPGKFADFPRSG
jgi:hypothetical protein